MTGPARAPTAGDFMNREVHCLSAETSLTGAIEFLQRYGISSAPVVETRDGKRVLLGYVSERDCLQYLISAFYFAAPAPDHTAFTIMKRHPLCVGPDTDPFALASIFIHHGYRHIPVVEDGALLGIVSRRDILKALNAYFQSAERERDHLHHPPDFGEIVNHRFFVSWP